MFIRCLKDLRNKSSYTNVTLVLFVYLTANYKSKSLFFVQDVREILHGEIFLLFISFHIYIKFQRKQKAMEKL